MAEKPLDDLNKEAIDLLVERFGHADTVRFLRQFSGGLGDYTQERQTQPDERLEDVIGAIQAKRQEVSEKSSPERPSTYESWLRVLEARHRRAYAPWTPNEEQELAEKYEAGESIDTLATQLGRQPGAIRLRLRKLGLIG